MLFYGWSHFATMLTFHRGRGMPRGGPRGAMRGGAPRGGAPRGAPSGRGGPSAAPNRGGASSRSRPPAAGAQRMLPSAALSHQQVQSGSQPKPDGYDDYVSYSWFIYFHSSNKYHSSVLSIYFPYSLHMKILMQSLHMRDMIIIIINKLHPRKSTD